jgi:hypothetical protein
LGDESQDGGASVTADRLQGSSVAEAETVAEGISPGPPMPGGRPETLPVASTQDVSKDKDLEILELKQQVRSSYLLLRSLVCFMVHSYFACYILPLYGGPDCGLKKQSQRRLKKFPVTSSPFSPCWLDSWTTARRDTSAKI